MQYIGVDQHKKFSYIVVMDEKGRIVKEGKVVNDREELKAFLRGCREGRAKAVTVVKNFVSGSPPFFQILN